MKRIGWEKRGERVGRGEKRQQGEIHGGRGKGEREMGVAAGLPCLNTVVESLGCSGGRWDPGLALGRFDITKGD